MSSLTKIPAKQTLPRRFYGWYLVGVAWLLYGLGACPGYYSWPFFTPEIQSDIGLSRTQTGTVFGIFGFVISAVGPISGASISRWGIRNTMIGGQLLSALGFWLTSQSNGFTSCLVSFAILVGAGTGIGIMVPCQTLATEWFTRYRGRAIAVILTAGGAVGSAVTWFDRYIIDNFSYRDGWQSFVLLEFILIGITLLFIKNSPADIGQFPDGASGPLLDDGEIKNSYDEETTSTWTSTTTIRTPQFYILLLCNVANVIPWSVSIGHGRLHLEDSGITTVTATGILSVMVFMSVAGRLFGGLGDLVKPERVLACSLLLEGLGVLGFLFSSNPTMAYFSTTTIAIGFGASYTSLSVVAAKFYGKQRFAKTIGMLYLGSSFFNAPTAGIAGQIYDSFGSYTLAFATIASFSLVMGFIALRISPPIATKRLT